VVIGGVLYVILLWLVLLGAQLVAQLNLNSLQLWQLP
jgi:hypothetical protein